MTHHSTVANGSLCEAQFIVACLTNGWDLAIPFGGCRSYDFVIRRSVEEGWRSVQAKKAYGSTKHPHKYKYEVLEVGFRRSKGKLSGMQPYRKGDFDFLFAWHETGSWLIPWDEVEGNRSCVVVSGEKYARFKL